MPVQALTIDFWNTMVVARTNGASRQRQRLQCLVGIAKKTRPDLPDQAIKAAYQTALTRFGDAWTQSHHTPRTATLLEGIWQELSFPEDERLFAQTVRVFEEGVLHAPPALVGGLKEILGWAALHYRLAIISDTMFSPGRVLRQMLDAEGLLHYFEAFIFSDEIGFSKPDARAFHAAADTLNVPHDALAHIGDLRRTDVAGALGAGARAIQFTGVHHDPEAGPEPDHRLARWLDLPTLLTQQVY